jgi:hypothetical protein
MKRISHNDNNVKSLNSGFLSLSIVTPSSS